MASRAPGESTGRRLVVGKTPGVPAEDHVAEAGRKVMRFHLARMLDREAGTRGGTNNEESTKMRVATRRQRAAWRVFGESFRESRTKRYRRACARSHPAWGPCATSMSCSRPPICIARICRWSTSAPRAAARHLAAASRRRAGAARCASSIRTATGAGSTTTATSCGRRARRSSRWARWSRIASVTRHRPASGPPTSTSAAMRLCSAGLTSRRSTSCGSPASGCATRSSSC